MKKILLTITLAALTYSCSEDFLNNSPAEFASQEQLNDLAASSPEALLGLNVGTLNATNTFLQEFSTNGGNIHDDFGLMSIGLGLDLMSTDMNMSINHWFGRYYNYTGRQQVSRITDMVWNFYFRVIRDTNSIISQIPQTATDPALLNVLGRAEALRGMAYFNMIRLYGDGTRGIPLYNQDETITSRAPQADIYQQALTDLTNAYTHLANYSRPDKTQVNQDVVAGLLARLHMDMGDYSSAIAMATQARNSVSLMNTAQQLDGFDDISNPEWMWGADINNTTSTIYASFFSHIGNLNPGYAGLLNVYKNIDKTLYETISATDNRLNWFDGPGNGLPMYANTKFVDATFFEGDYVYMRGAEMYLIEAEARALSGDDGGAAQALFNLVSTRDASYTLSTNTGATLLDEIRNNKRVEMWGEGLAFYDMKRWNAGLNRDYAGTNHPAFGRFNFAAGANELVFQIPEDEINTNLDITLSDQNPL